jgi:hypothetical protein
MGIMRLLLLPLLAVVWAAGLPFVGAYAVYVAWERDFHSGMMTVVRFTRWVFSGKTWH